MTSWEIFSGWKSRVSWESHRETTCVSGRRGKYSEIQTWKQTPNIIKFQVNYVYPKLEWFQIYRGNEDAGTISDSDIRIHHHLLTWSFLLWPFQYFATGELLAAFEMFELGDTQRPLPPVPPIKNESNQNTGPIMPIPPEIKPTLVKYRFDYWFWCYVHVDNMSLFIRFEVLFWGLRDLKRVQFLTVDKPRVDVECGGHIIQVCWKVVQICLP